MLERNITYYRLKKGISKKDLASIIGVTPMAVTYYENGDRKPDLAISRRIASALDVSLADLMSVQLDHHEYQFCEYRKNSSLAKKNQEFIEASIRKHFDGFLLVADAVGAGALKDAPQCHQYVPEGDSCRDAAALRNWLGIGEEGPILNLVGLLENKGFLVYLLDYHNNSFSGINGFVDGRPYIVINSSVTAERQRSTIAHELAHLFFTEKKEYDQSWEDYMTAVSGSFLFPDQSVIDELGIRRSGIGSDMVIVAEEYGISMQLLVKRAREVGVISQSVYKAFFVILNKNGGRKNEPSRIKAEKTTLFEQLVLRAASESQISLSKAAELLQIPLFDLRNKMTSLEAF